MDDSLSTYRRATEGDENATFARQVLPEESWTEEHKAAAAILRAATRSKTAPGEAPPRPSSVDVEKAADLLAEEAEAIIAALPEVDENGIRRRYGAEGALRSQNQSAPWIAAEIAKGDVWYDAHSKARVRGA